MERKESLGEGKDWLLKRVKNEKNARIKMQIEKKKKGKIFKGKSRREIASGKYDKRIFSPGQFLSLSFSLTYSGSIDRYGNIDKSPSILLTIVF